MGHKVHPKVFRMGVIYSWGSKWFARKKDYADQVREDVLIKAFVFFELKDAGIDSVEIERKGDAIVVIVNAAKPGIIIGRSGIGSEGFKKKLKDKFWRGKKVNLNINIFEVKRPAFSANIVAQGVVADLEKRMPFRRVMKMAIDRVRKSGAEGIKIAVGGRLNGSEIARTEKMLDGKVPLTNLRADIDFAYGIAHTTYGVLGVKVWIYRGEIFDKVKKETDSNEEEVRDKK
ncbi:MAG: 30S ribosomal protein S3 [bacterium]